MAFGVTVPPGGGGAYFASVGAPLVGGGVDGDAPLHAIIINAVSSGAREQIVIHARYPTS